MSLNWKKAFTPARSIVYAELILWAVFFLSGTSVFEFISSHSNQLVAVSFLWGTPVLISLQLAAVNAISLKRSDSSATPFAVAVAGIATVLGVLILEFLAFFLFLGFALSHFD
jgi:hypothetical protein